ncbi:GIY-YIG nuclease family protein [Burkholderia pyrrocinia]|uniref:GIY-YIG nuclease family protein n=1 Tax=Burkholderia pyrrocinia TaxID=60550 RepID=UPI0030D3DDCF
MGGYVYVMTNKSVRGLVKIGKTKHPPHQRAKGLDRAQLPYSYEVRHFVRVPDPHRVEKEVQARLAEFRETRGHEWFRCSIEDAISVVEEIARDAANRPQFDEESRRQKILRTERRATTEQLRLEQQGARVRAAYAYEPLMSATGDLGPLLWHLRPARGSRVQHFTDFFTTRKATEPALTFTEYRRYLKAIKAQCEALGITDESSCRDLATAVKSVYGAIPLSMQREAITKRKQREAKQSATCARKPTAGLTKPKKAK